MKQNQKDEDEEKRTQSSRDSMESPGVVQTNKILSLIRKNNGYVTTSELVKEEVNPYYIHALKKSGRIVPVKRGVYKANEESHTFNFDDSIVDVFKIIPHGVLCLKSALSYHHLTTYLPKRYEIAIERDQKIALPPYPPIKLVFFSRIPFETGIQTQHIDGHLIRVYDLEKTVIDCIRYRDKIGQDIVKEALENYIRRNDRNINTLLEYAKICRVQGILNRYLEVLI